MPHPIEARPRTREEGIRTQRPSLAWKPLAAVLGPSLVAVLVLGLQTRMSHQALVGETLDEVQGPGYFGLISNATIGLWVAGAFCAALAALALAPRFTGGSNERVFFGAFAAWTLYLGIDDAYILHESIIPAHLGLSEHLVTALYFVLAAALGWTFRRRLLQGQVPLLAAAVTCFAASEFVDQILQNESYKFTEESLKFLGVACWAGYLAVTATVALRSRMRADG